MKLSRTYFLFFDIIFLVISYVLVGLIKEVEWPQFWYRYSMPLGLFTLVWISISLLRKKYWWDKKDGFSGTAKKITKSNVYIILLVTFVLFFGQYGYSRIVLVGAMAFTTLFELLATAFYIYDRGLSKAGKSLEQFQTQEPLDMHTAKVECGAVDAEMLDDTLRQTVIDYAGVDAFEFIDHHLRGKYARTAILSITDRFNIDTLPEKKFWNIVNLHRMNDIRFINKFYESVNAKLPEGGWFISCVETAKLRKQRIMKKYPPGINYFMYSGDFLVKRIGPKLWITKKLYFLFTRGNNRVLAKPEAIGRLYSCGFELLEEHQSNGALFLLTRKVKEPAFDMNPTYGPLVKLRRYGKDGKPIGVYKMRTMHPFAEYLQEYVYEKNSLDHGGKFKNDFRVTTAGKIMRKLWLDELPMLINLVKGDLKLVGVRPLSKHYLELYDKDLQEQRFRFKPGLVPPFYVDMPGTLSEIMDSERRYLDAYEKHPLRTDWVYFWKAFNNIVFKRARSK